MFLYTRNKYESCSSFTAIKGVKLHSRFPADCPNNEIIELLGYFKRQVVLLVKEAWSTVSGSSDKEEQESQVGIVASRQPKHWIAETLSRNLGVSHTKIHISQTIALKIVVIFLAVPPGDPNVILQEASAAKQS